MLKREKRNLTWKRLSPNNFFGFPNKAQGLQNKPWALLFLLGSKKMKIAGIFFAEYRSGIWNLDWVCVFQYSRLDEHIPLVFHVSFKAGDSDLQAVVVDSNLIPPQRMQLQVGLFRINAWFQ